MAFVNNKLKFIPPIESFLNPVSLSNTPIPLSDRAEHVGVIRESSDIFPHILLGTLLVLVLILPAFGPMLGLKCAFAPLSF